MNWGKLGAKLNSPFRAAGKDATDTNWGKIGARLNSPFRDLGSYFSKGFGGFGKDLGSLNPFSAVGEDLKDVEYWAIAIVLFILGLIIAVAGREHKAALAVGLVLMGIGVMIIIATVLKGE